MTGKIDENNTMVETAANRKSRAIAAALKERDGLNQSRSDEDMPLSPLLNSLPFEMCPEEFHHEYVYS